MKDKKYLERKKARKIRSGQYAMMMLGLDPGPIYLSPSEIKEWMNKIEKIRNTINFELKERKNEIQANEEII